MAIPTLWSLQSERLRYTTANGWENVQTWTGPAGTGGATRDDWLANFAGYSSLEMENARPRDDGDGLVTANIGFACTSTGEPIPDTDPDYGLIARKWTKHTNRLQSSLLSHPNAGALRTAGSDDGWPERIRTEAMAYAVAQRLYARGESTTEPDPTTFVNRARPSGYTPTGTNLEIETWLFAEFAADEDASWEVSQPVLRKTEEVITATALAAVHADTDRFYTSAKLAAVEGSLSLALLVDAAGLEDYVWLKTSPEVEEVSGGRFQIVQEYEGWLYVSPNTLMRYGAVIDVA